MRKDSRVTRVKKVATQKYFGNGLIMLKSEKSNLPLGYIVLNPV